MVNAVHATQILDNSIYLYQRRNMISFYNYRAHFKVTVQIKKNYFFQII